MSQRARESGPPAAQKEPDEIELAVVVLNYRTAKLSQNCLDSIAEDVLPGMQVVVVDNASGDGSDDAIAAHIEARGYGAWARVLRSPVNGGFSAGNNLALRSVPARMYVLLNSDTLVRPGALSELRRVLLERLDVGLVGPSFEDESGGLLESCHDLPHPVRELVRTANTGVVDRVLSAYARAPRHSDLPLEPVWMPFACVAFRRDVLDTVGLLDDGFFMYFEDIDYCLRVRDAGFRLLYWPRARIVHLVGKSSNVTAAEAQQKRAPRYYYEARTRFYAKHFGLSGLMLANAAWLAGRSVSRTRQFVQRDHLAVREGEARDIWTNTLHPFRASSKRPAARTK
ncbi:MAG: glycosyltransferase family 2 protein [Polyangiales bacterium]